MPEVQACHPVMIDDRAGTEQEKEKNRGMKIFLKRLLGYLCLSLFLALAAGPFTGVTRVKETVVKKTVRTYYPGPGGGVISGHYGTTDIDVPEKTTAPIKWFKSVRYTMAVLFLIIGVWAMRGVYRRLPGITLNPKPLARLNDGICVLFLALGAFCVVEYLMIEHFKMLPFLDDERAFAMIACAYIPVAVFLALFTTKQFGQSLEIREEGITVYAPGGSILIPWKNVKGFELKNTYGVTGGERALIPRKIQTKLLIQTPERAVELVEPGQKKVKTEVIRALREKAPSILQNAISGIAEKW
jgi:hypothetical protein